VVGAEGGSLAARPGEPLPVGGGGGGDGGEWGGSGVRIVRGVIHWAAPGGRRARTAEGGFTSAAARGGRGFRFPAGQGGGP
jgi:hypothetical protein